MNRRRLALAAALVLVSLPLLCTGSLAAWQVLRPQPAPRSEMLFEGVEYIRDVRTTPREIVIHVALVDLQAEGLRLLVTPGDPDADLSLSAQTTSRFLAANDLQLAVNGDAFEPWTSASIFRYYPHPGDPVDPIGYAASQGTVYAEARQETPTLYLSQNNNARFNRPFGNEYNAISGTAMLVENGRNAAPADETLAPRTAIGLNRSGRQLVILVVDGRQPGYSEGVTLRELADLLIYYGAHDAMNLDGGGSSTLVREGPLGNAVLLNNPIDRNVPGWERAVGNHLGIYARDLER